VPVDATERTEGAVDVEALAPPPRSLDEIGIPENVLTELVLRRVMFDGRSTLGRMSQTVGVPPGLLETLARYLREQKKYLDFESMVGNDWVVGLTALGRQLAEESMKRLSYAGIAPVTLETYKRSTTSWSTTGCSTRSARR
jgi:hypothetical protein